MTHEPNPLSGSAVVAWFGVVPAVMFGLMAMAAPGWPRAWVAALVTVATVFGWRSFSVAGAPVSILRLSGAVLVVAAVVITIIPPPPTLEEGNDGPDGGETTLTAAERVLACMAVRHMEKARDRTETDLEKGPVDADLLASVVDRADLYTQVVYRDCSWPPGPGASADGYYSITELVTAGPGPGEASSANVLHRITATCATLRLTWSTGAMGESERLPAYDARIGDLIEAWHGKRYVPGKIDRTNPEPYVQPMPYPYPRSAELVVLSNSKIGLDDAHCVG